MKVYLAEVNDYDGMGEHRAFRTLFEAIDYLAGTLKAYGKSDNLSFDLASFDVKVNSNLMLRVLNGYGYQDNLKHYLRSASYDEAAAYLEKNKVAA